VRPWPKQRHRMYIMRDKTPEDLATGMARDRRRFLEKVMVDPSQWRIARTLATRMRGEHGEGLRGVFTWDGEGPGTIRWWFRDDAAHFMGRLHLGISRSGNDESVLEVEMNVDSDGTIYPCWSSGSETAEELGKAFTDHPTISPLIDGCLSRNGRLIVLSRDGTGIRLPKSPPPERDRRDPRHPGRQKQWDALVERVRTWSATRRRTEPDGSTPPSRTSLATFRLWIGTHSTWHHANAPVPTVKVREDGTIVATWRSSDHVIRHSYLAGTIHVREVCRGRLRETIHEGLTTDRRMGARGPRIPYEMRSHGEET
jgi:hypothetical protein